MIIVNIEDPNNPTFVGNYNLDGGPSDVTISENYAYFFAGDNLKIINIEDPTNSTLAGSYDTGDYVRSVTISGNYAYIPNDDLGLLILDRTPFIPVAAEENQIDNSNDEGPVEDSIEEESPLPSISLITSIISIGLLAIFRRK